MDRHMEDWICYISNLEAECSHSTVLWKRNSHKNIAVEILSIYMRRGMCKKIEGRLELVRTGVILCWSLNRQFIN